MLLECILVYNTFKPTLKKFSISKKSAKILIVKMGMLATYDVVR